MTIRPGARRCIVGPCATIPMLCIAALALLAPRVHAEVFRSTLGIAAGPTFPVGSRHPIDDGGSTYFGIIAVGDEFSTMGISLGYTVFGGGPFEDRGASVSQFELLADCAPFAPNTYSPYLRIGAGAYNVDGDRSSGDDVTARRFGFTTGVGMRWAPRWDSAVTLVASYHNLPSRGDATHQWVAVTLEVLRWMD